MVVYINAIVRGSMNLYSPLVISLPRLEPTHTCQLLRAQHSFPLSIPVILVLAAFPCGAPAPSPADDVPACHDEHTKDVSLEVFLTTAVKAIAPTTIELGERGDNLR